MAEAFLRLSAGEQREALEVAASACGRPIHLLEKDIWVVWSLGTLFGAPFAEHLVFKGGTSLSKGYGAIQRFSEDVDLTYDIRALVPDMVGDNPQALPPTRSQEKKWSREVRARLSDWVAGTVGPVLEAALQRESLSATLRVEADKVFIDYEPLAIGSGYVSPSVMLEFGARSTGEPAEQRCIVCDAAEHLTSLTFSALLDEIIRSRREKALQYEEYLKQIADLVKRVEAGTAEDTPEKLDTPGKRALYNNLENDEELALRLDAAVKKNAPDGWRGNEPKERVIKKALYQELGDKDEVERIFLIIKAQKEY